MQRALTAFWLVLATTPVLAGNEMDMRGSTVTPTDNLTIYNAPPNAILRRGQQPKAILHPGAGATQMFPLGQTQGGYVVQSPNALSTDSFVVSDQVDVVQNGEVQRWLQLTDDAGGSVGWVVCQDSDGDCSGMTTQQGGN